MIENKSIGSKVFDVVNVVILILITLVCILPGLNCPMRLWKAWRMGRTGS